MHTIKSCSSAKVRHRNYSCGTTCHLGQACATAWEIFVLWSPKEEVGTLTGDAKRRLVSHTPLAAIFHEIPKYTYRGGDAKGTDNAGDFAEETYFDIYSRQSVVCVTEVITDIAASRSKSSATSICNKKKIQLYGRELAMSSIQTYTVICLEAIHAFFGTGKESLAILENTAAYGPETASLRIPLPFNTTPPHQKHHQQANTQPHKPARDYDLNKKHRILTTCDS
ncbi:hypothetical protein HYALB_00002546 [Hymenoscyphus albidus]|uniref:Uncharacterized protein n=1 Tax=Hymenoscyphus albidus TaxID=595503 RepID=A0A9N9Q9Z2_9HELO|nr:hypothetical protein HYALB_00002546 [Hymenoscyphus albidus]